jgi:hypothetical protein
MTVVVWLFITVVTAAIVLTTCSGLASCTIEPHVDAPQINIGCVVVELGNDKIVQCPDAGVDGGEQ